ncbi:unnamed protein product [Pleuronectes platessa]|uniref:Uncharacterized protein n=1 Tax=Pleuronectes platessa TaxID=8262 RepID=A0A9N7VCS1_PLEPL|nr:unnamed protein product [Pleuronectes platessa]
MQGARQRQLSLDESFIQLDHTLLHQLPAAIITTSPAAAIQSRSLSETSPAAAMQSHHHLFALKESPDHACPGLNHHSSASYCSASTAAAARGQGPGGARGPVNLHHSPLVPGAHQLSDSVDVFNENHEAPGGPTIPSPLSIMSTSLCPPVFRPSAWQGTPLTRETVKPRGTEPSSHAHVSLCQVHQLERS